MDVTKEINFDDFDADAFDVDEVKVEEDRIKIFENNGVIKCFYIYNSIDSCDNIDITQNEKQDGECLKILAEIDEKNGITSIYPFYTFIEGDKFLTSKYENIEKIVFKGYDIRINDRNDGNYKLLNGLPKPFVLTLVHGLGFKKEYRIIADVISKEFPLCNEIIITKNDASSINETSITINDPDLDAIRRGLDRIINNGRKEIVSNKTVFAYSEILHKLEPTKYPEKKVPLKKDVIYKTLRNVDLQKSNISSADKEGLLAIKDSVDLGYLTALKKEFENLISSNHKEEYYQKFLQKNPLLLTMFAGSPYIQFKNQAYVGGKSFDNANGKYPDFLLKHKIVNNTFIVEIKKPSTKLLEMNPYRGTDVFAPSNELSGAISQFLDQKYELETNIANLTHTAEDRNVEAYNVQGLVIVGHSNSLTEQAHKRSFELYRNNQKNVRVITYDECLEQLTSFVNHLSGKINKLQTEEESDAAFS